MPIGQTITQFIVEEQRRYDGTGDFTALLNDTFTACKNISNAVNKGALIGVLGSLGSENVQGETQKKLDVISNDMMLTANDWGGHLAAMASEEMEDVYQIPGGYPRGKYLLVFDPLDGSSNIDVNISVGTIFSVLRCPEGVDKPTVAFPPARNRADLRRLRPVRTCDHDRHDHRPWRQWIHSGSERR